MFFSVLGCFRTDTIYATLNQDYWLVNTPDKAAMRFAYNLGYADRLVSLEQMLKAVSPRSKIPLRDNYTEQWLRTERTKMLLG